ncbi:TPA: hypothetical protein RZK14_001709, partial [Campylobacter coli]|nr:hypothetical protein [Campylobacter coli]
MFFKKNDLINITDCLGMKYVRFTNRQTSQLLIYSKKKYCLRHIIFDRVDFNVEELIISISINLIEWKKIEYKYYIDKHLRITIEINVPIYFKYIKLKHKDIFCIARSNITILTTKFLGLILSNRPDGFASRMWAFLNAMYIAKKTGFKFGFVWPRFDDVGGIISKKYITIDSEENMFDVNFIQRYSYTYDHLPQTHSYDNCLGPLSLKNIQQLPFYEEYGHLITCCMPLYELIFDIEVQEYQYKLQQIWNSLPFSTTYLSIKNSIENICHKLNNHFVAIHIRGGDIVNGDHRFFISSSLWTYLYPLELAVELIKMLLNKKARIIVFSDDNEAIEMIKKNLIHIYYDLENLYFSKDLAPKYLSVEENIFFNFQLLSKSKYIYGSQWSTFRILAGFLGGSKKQETVSDTFTYNEQYQILNNSLRKIKTNKRYKSASYMYLYIIGKNIGKDKEHLIKILRKGFRYDPENFSFKIKIIDLLFELDVARAEYEIRNIFFEKKYKFIELLFSKFYKIEFEVEWKNYLKFASKNYPYISLIASYIAFYIGDIEKTLKLYSYYKNNQEIKNITDKAFVCEIFQKNFYYLNQKIIDKNMA